MTWWQLCNQLSNIHLSFGSNDDDDDGDSSEMLFSNLLLLLSFSIITSKIKEKRKSIQFIWKKTQLFDPFFIDIKTDKKNIPPLAINHTHTQYVQ